MHSALWRVGGLTAICLCFAPANAAVSAPTITPSLDPPQKVGSPVTFTVAATDTDPGLLRFRFRIRAAGGTFVMLRDYAPSTTLTWTPTDAEGTYELEVTAANQVTGSTAAASLSYAITPVVTGNAPIISATLHPLVALYSAPPCPAGSTIRVRLKQVNDIVWQALSQHPCNGVTTANFLIGGMREDSAYQVLQEVFTGGVLNSGPISTFTSGHIAVDLPAVSVALPLAPPTSLTEGITLFAAIGFPAIALDSGGNIVWYDASPGFYMTRPVPGGTFLKIFGYTTDLANSGFREVDLAGNIVRETTVERLNAQLAAAGMSPITTVHHEVRRLDNGNYLLLGMSERMSDVQGPDTDIAGDMILILDSNLQLVWAWDSFDHLDVNRKAVLGETCGIAPGQCVLLNAKTANDWTHGNSASLTPDGNILYSARHQDRVYKIAYNNGSGDGHIIWTLGKDGDFTWQSNDPYPWFSHQHDAEFESEDLISLFDNGNTRVGQFGGNSRGEVLQIDETNKLITPVLLADVGSYSAALGTAQRLTNGNYEFDSGLVPGPNAFAVEVDTNSRLVSSLNVKSLVYRVFRTSDLTLNSNTSYVSSPTAQPGAILESAAGTVLALSSQDFTWREVPGATNYRLLIGSAPGLGDFFSGDTPGLSLTATGLPVDGRPEYVKVVATVGPTQISHDQVYNGLRFVSLAPCRLSDTRVAGGILTGGSARDFAIAGNCSVPSNALAYSLNITVVPSQPLGYLTAWPSGQARPLVSTLNSDGRIKANAAIVPAGSNGSISVFVTDPTDVVLDINGYFVPASAGNNLVFYPLAPCRLADTRNPAGPFGAPTMAALESRSFPVRQSPCNIPPDAQAYSLNFTVVPQGPLGYLTTWPSDHQQPFVSTLNSLNGTVVANAAIVPASPDGSINVFVTNPTDVVIDINGYFAPRGRSGALSFYAAQPCRVADTRLGDGAFGGPAIAAGATRTFYVPASTCGIPAAAQAFALNTTVVPQQSLSYLTLWAAGQVPPFVSTLNSWDGSIVANAAIAPAGTGGGISALATDTTALILDINGFFAP